MCEKNNELISIDCELIRQLRSQGRNFEAKEHLKKFRECIEKEKHDIYRNILNTDNKIKRIYFYKIHKCCQCRKDIEPGFYLCESCKIKKHENDKYLRKTRDIRYAFKLFNKWCKKR